MKCEQDNCIHVIKNIELEGQLFELRNKPTPANKPETSDRKEKKCDCPSCEMVDRAEKAEAESALWQRELKRVQELLPKSPKAKTCSTCANDDGMSPSCCDCGDSRDNWQPIDWPERVAAMERRMRELSEENKGLRDNIRRLINAEKKAGEWQDRFCYMAVLYVEKVCNKGGGG